MDLKKLLQFRFGIWLWAILLPIVFFSGAFYVYAASSTWTQNTGAAFDYGKKSNVTVSGDAFTLSSATISNQLSGTAINDVYVYDTTQDSDTATQISLGVDPNWRNGVVKYYGTIADNDSENIQVGVPDNDYTNGNIIDLRFTTGGTIGTAIYEWRERTTTDYTSVSFNGTDTLTKTGAFANSRVGDQILITGGTGITKGYVTITAVNSSDSVTIGTDIGGSVADLAATVITGSWTNNITTSTSLTELGSIGVTVSFTSGTTFTAGNIYQINSWYTEALDATELGTCNIATMDRCGSRKFPKKSILVATNSNLYVIDTKNNTMWMRFDGGTSTNFIQQGNQRAVSIVNGELFTGSSSTGLHSISFSLENPNAVTFNGKYIYKGNINDRNSGVSWTEAISSEMSIINANVNDVHAAVIDGKTYVAVATDGGVSVINETDGTVVDFRNSYAGYYYNNFRRARMDNNGSLYLSNALSSNGRYLSVIYHDNAIWSTGFDGDIFNGSNDAFYAAQPITLGTGLGGLSLASISTAKLDYDVSSGYSVFGSESNMILFGTNDRGLTVLQEKQSDESNGSVKYFTKDYITEEMIGDIRGMWTFDQAGIGNGDTTIANTEDVQDRSVRDTDMTVVDGGGTAPQLVDGVRGKAIQFDGANDYLRQKVYEDQTGAIFGPTYHGLNLANGSAFYRAQGVSLASYIGSTTPYMLVLKDSTLKTAWGYLGVADATETLGSELVTTNAGFETFTGTQDDGTSDDFGTWSESNVNDLNGDKIEATTTSQSGSSAIKITTGIATPYISMSNISASVGKLYKLTFWTRGDGTNAGRWYLRSLPSNTGLSTWVGSTGVPGSTYAQVTHYFTLPSGDNELRIQFFNPSSGSAYYDDLSIKEVTDVGTDGAHIVSTKGGSTRNWAGIESGFNYNDSAYTFEVRKTDFQITGNLTVGAWVKTSKTGNQFFVGKGKWAGGGSEYEYVLRSSNGYPGFSLDSNHTSPYDLSADGTTTIFDNMWHHLVGTYEWNTDTVNLYLDGKNVATSQVNGDYTSSYTTFLIGADMYGLQQTQGLIDEPFVTSEALTASDILRMWRTGCKAMGGTPNEPGGGSPNTCDNIPGTHPTNTLAGSQNAVYGVTVDRTDTDNPYAYVATSGSGTGALSKINLASDTLVESWTTGSSLALPSNNLSGGVFLGGVGSVALGTDSGFSILNSGFSPIGSLISGTSAGTGYGYNTGGNASITTFTPTTSGSGTSTFYLRGGTNETMTTGLTPWYDVTSGTIPAGVNGKQYYQYQGILEPTSNGSSSPSVSSITMTYEGLPTVPSGLATSSRGETSITWSYTDNSDNEDEFLIKDGSSNTVCETNAVDTTICEETGLTPNTQYTRTVRSSNGAGDSADSSSASAYTLPGTPTSLSISSGWNSTDSYYNTLSWSSGGGETSYKVYLGGDKDTGTLLATVLSGTTSYAHTALTANTAYTYYVYGYGGDGDDYSPDYTSTSKTTSPNQVLGLAQDVANTTATAINWSWTQVAEAAGYRIYSAITQTINSVAYAAGDLLQMITSGSTTAWLMEGLQENFAYQIYLKAANALGELGRSSSTASGSVTANAPAISLTALSPDPTGDSTPTFTGTATDTMATVASVQFQVDSTSGTWNSCTADDGSFDEAIEAFTCSITTALTDGAHIIYVRATDSNNNTTASGSEASDSFTVDLTAPTTLDLNQPGDQSYTNSERPIFKWKSSGDTSGLLKYTLEVDNPSLGVGNPAGDFSIDNIPTFRTTDYETDKFVVRYENFSDNDDNNNYITLQTRSTSSGQVNSPWSTDSNTGENDGKLREGKVIWKVKAVDNVGNEISSSRTLFVDRNGPTVEVTGMNGNVTTTDKTPIISGKITDPLAGSSTSSGQNEDGPKIASGPKSVEIKIEKYQPGAFGLIPSYTLHTLYTINLDTSTSSVYKLRYTCDDSRIEDNTKQKCDKYANWEYTTKDKLETGIYRITVNGKDKADNDSTGTVQITLNITTWEQITTVEEKEIIRDTDEKQLLTQEEKEKVKEEQEIAKPWISQQPKEQQAETASSRFIAAVFNQITKTLELMRGTAGSAIDWTSDKLEQGLDYAGNIGKMIGDNYSRLAQKAPGIAGIILTGAGKGASTIANVVENVTGKIGALIKKTGEATLETAAVANQAIARLAQNGLKSVNNSIAYLSFGIGERAQDVSDTAGIAIMKFGSQFVTEPTIIFDVQVAIVSPTSVKISWETNHPANGKVNWGTDRTYPSDIQSEKRVNHHEFVLKDLNPDTLYYFEVMSHNKNYVYDANREFRTPAVE